MPKPSQNAATVDVRLLSKRYTQIMPDGSEVERERGDTFPLSQLDYEKSFSRRDENGVTVMKSLTFRLVSEERKESETVEAQKRDPAKRFNEDRETNRQALEGLMKAQALAAQERAAQAQALASALAPLAGVGAKVTA